MASKPPPRRMKIHEVPDYIDRVHGVLITKMTAYNWTSKGVKGEKLKFILGKTRPKGFPDVRLTTPDWVEEFLVRRAAVMGGGL